MAMEVIPMGNYMEFIDKRLNPASMVGDYRRITGLRNALNSYSATTYTAAYMDKMTHNDMVYAVRLISDPTGI